MKIIQIEQCLDCPNFDDIYNIKKSFCHKHMRNIEDNFTIPEWCELEDDDDGDYVSPPLKTIRRLK